MTSNILSVLLLFLATWTTATSMLYQPNVTGYRFYNSKAFAELPPASLCGPSFTLSFEFTIARSPYTLLLALLPAGSLIITGDRRQISLTISGQTKAVVNLPLEQRQHLHTISVSLMSHQLFFGADKHENSTLLSQDSLVTRSDLESARVFLGVPPASQVPQWQPVQPKRTVRDKTKFSQAFLKLRPGFEGIVRNVIGQRKCECPLQRHLPFIALRAVDTRRPEVCLLKNKCKKSCVCKSQNDNMVCESCLPTETVCKEQPEIPKFAVISFDHRSPAGRFLSDQFPITAHGNVQYQAQGKVGSSLRLHDNAFIDLGPRYDCYGDLERCENGLTIRFWMRPFSLGRPKAFLLSSRSYDLFTDRSGRLNAFFKTRENTWASRGQVRLQKNVWQALELAWSAADGLVINLDGKRVETVKSPLDIDTKFIDDARIYVGAASEMDGRSAGGIDVDELQLLQEPPRPLDVKPTQPSSRIDAKVFQMKVTAEDQLLNVPDSRVFGKPDVAPSFPIGAPVIGLASKLLQSIDLGREVICRRDDVAECPHGFTIRLWIYPLRVEGTYDLLSSNLVKATFHNDRLVVVVNGKYRSWTAAARTPPIKRWSLLEITWSRQNGLQLFVDTQHVAGVVRALDKRRSPVFADMRLRLGAGADGNVNPQSRSAVRLAQLEIWPASRDQLRRLGRLSVKKDRLNVDVANEKPQAQQPINERRNNDRPVAFMQFSSSPVIYNMNSLDGGDRKLENLRIEFSTTGRNGMLYSSDDRFEATFLYLENGVLTFHYVVRDSRKDIEYEAKETLKIPPKKVMLYDGRRHTIEISRNDNRMTLIIDGRNIMEKEIRFRKNGSRRLFFRDEVYLGGSRTNQYGSGLTGKIYKATVQAHPNRPKFYLVRDIEQYSRTGRVTFKDRNQDINNFVVFVPRPKPTIPTVPPTIPAIDEVIRERPRGNINGYPGRGSVDVITRGGGGTGEEAESSDFYRMLSKTPVAYTFFKPDGLIRLPTWQYPSYKSMEIEFVTFEPRGVLFYAGPGRDGHKDFVCVEIFDGHLYFVYNHNELKNHVKLSDVRVDNGNPHRVYFSIAKTGVLSAKFNGREVNLPESSQPHGKIFRTYTYIGSLDSFSPENSRAPWNVWSREGFSGCVNYIKLNDGVGYADARKFQNQHSVGSKLFDTCEMPANMYCMNGNQDCGGIGACHKRWYGTSDDDNNFYCDCSKTSKTKSPQDVSSDDLEIRGAPCDTKAAVVKFDGKTRSLVSFVAKGEYSTHTDDISIRFKTRRPDGGIFTTMSRNGRTYLMLYLQNGQLLMRTNVFDARVGKGGMKRFTIGSTTYNDDRWHTVYIQRRANFMRYWVDNERRKEEHLPKYPDYPEDYRMGVKFIHLGNFNGSQEPFVGSLSNFYWNAYDFLTNPFQTGVYRVQIFGLKPTIPPPPIEPPPIMPTNPITVTEPIVEIVVRPEMDVDFEGGRDTTFMLEFRTIASDGLIFFLSANRDKYITAELVNGALFYSYNLGYPGQRMPYPTTVNDGNWHQIFVHLSRKGEHILWIDSKKFSLQNIVKKMQLNFRVFLAAMPPNMWSYLPTSMQARSHRKGIVGCLASLVINGQFKVFEANNYDVTPASSAMIGQCRPQLKCSARYCLNGGQCREESFGKLKCECANTGYKGDKCEIRIPPRECPRGHCANGGFCSMINGRPKCDCRGGYEGPQCRIMSKCPRDHCKNNGRCSVGPSNEYICDCRRTGWTGPLCEDRTPGFQVDYERQGYVVYPINPPKPYVKDEVTLGFQTWEKDGTILTFLGPDKRYWSLVLRNGKLKIAVSGMEYDLPANIQTYNDGRYHVVNILREGEFTTVNVDGQRVGAGGYINIADNRGAITYSKIIVGANNEEKDVFRGAIGGFNWNGKTPLTNIPDDNKRGVIEIVVTPVDNLPRPKQKPKCVAGYCGTGKCREEDGRLYCDCSQTQYIGKRCSQKMYGILVRDKASLGSLVYRVIDIPPKLGSNHRLEVALQTFEPNFPIIRFEGKNNVYLQLLMRDGYIDVDENGRIRRLNRSYSRINNGYLHRISTQMIGNYMYIYLNGKKIGNLMLPRSLYPENYQRIVLGNEDGRVSMNGVVGGFNWNGRRLFRDRGVLMPGVVKGGGSGTIVVELPYMLTKPRPTVPPPRPPVPPSIPNTGAHGGIVWNPVRPSIDGAGPAVLVPGPDGNSARGGAYGGGAIVMAGPGPIVAMSAIGVASPLAAGFVAAVLLFISAMVWACWRCKPGWCPCFGGAGSGAGGGASAVRAGYTRIPRMIAKPLSSLFAGGKASAAGAGAGAATARTNIIKVDITDTDAAAVNGGLHSTSAREMHSLNLHGASGDNISVKSVPIGGFSSTSRFDYFRQDAASDAFGHTGHGYYRQASAGAGTGGGMRLDVTNDRFGTMGSTYHMEAMGGGGGGHMQNMESTTLTTAAAHTLGNNVFLNEEIKVDCCQISANSKYVVTGSSTGPPQVWDMKTGDLIKVMDGQEAGCTDLHLACGDSVLVAQVLDDLAGTESMLGGETGRRMRRLQLWDFATGRAMEMPMDINCTSSCVTWAGEHVVVARNEASGPSILVWDLFANESAREIRYQHPAGMSPETGMTYLAVTPDDQIVVAGFTHSGDTQANYLCFGLEGPVSPPLHVVFDANLDCTELLATPHEAITGNRRGELFIWDLTTGKPLRSISIVAQLERAGTHSLPPHNGEIRALSLSRDGQYLVTGSTDRMVKVWSMLDEKMILTLDGHTDDILTACISDDNEVVVSGSWDGSIRVWRMRDGSQMCWFTSNIEVFNVKVSHDKQAIVALGERGGHRKLIMLQILRNRTRRTRPRIASAR